MKRRRAQRPFHSRRSARRKSTREGKVVEKLIRMAYAKSQMAQQNYLIDALNEAGIIDSQTDKILHFATELSMGKGTSQERMDSYLRKAKRYKK